MSRAPSMTFQEAEELFAELLRVGPQSALDEIRRTACRLRLTPIQVLAERGDPRKEKP